MKWTRWMAGVAAFALAGTAAAQQSYVRLVVPFPPGDALETATRVLADLAKDELGRQIVVENKPGASGFIAADAVARSTDGATLLLGTTAMLGITPFLKKAPYDPADLKPVAQVAEITLVFAVSPTLKVDKWQDFVALARKNPGKYTYASPGEGTILHLSMEQLQSVAGFKMLHVPYKGMGPALQDFLGGQIDVYSEPAIIPHVAAGKAKALAVASDARLPELPSTPTFKELGVKLDTKPWIGVFAPRSAPDALGKQVEEALRKAAARPEFKAKLPPGVQPSFVGSEQFTKQIASEQTTFRQLIKTLNLKVE